MDEERELRPRSTGQRNQAQVTQTQFRYGLAPLPVGVRRPYGPGSRVAFLDEQLAKFFETRPEGVSGRGPIIKEFLAEGHPVREHLLKSGYARRYEHDPVELQSKMQAAINAYLSMMCKQHLYEGWSGVYRGCAVWRDPVQIRGETITAPLMPNIAGLEDEIELEKHIAAEESLEEEEEKLAALVERRRNSEDRLAEEEGLREEEEEERSMGRTTLSKPIEGYRT